MLRFLALISLALACATPGFACDMDLETRSDRIAQYVENGLACLKTPPNQLRFDTVMERSFLQRINEERESRGLSALKLRMELRPAARFHSLDMASNKFFKHESPDGRFAGQRIAGFDRTLLAQSTAENIAQFGPAVCRDQNERQVSCFELPGFKLPTRAYVVDDLHDKLMKSDGHRANILAPESTHISIGVARSDTAFYVTQVFANQVGELDASLPLTLRPGARLRAHANLKDWESSSFAVLDEAEMRIDLPDDRLKNVSPGQKSLVVRGETVATEEEGNRTYTTRKWLDLFGPDFTVARSARES